MYILLDPHKPQTDRIYASDGSAPLWFAAPIFKARPNSVISRNTSSYIAQAWLGTDLGNTLVFNVGLKEALLSLLPSPRSKWISLHQWRPDNINGVVRSFAKHRVLEKSEVILTYSKVDESDLKERYPQKKVKWIGHFVDTTYFSPTGKSKIKSERPYILCVGDHLRLESLLNSIAKKIGINIVRVTSATNVIEYHKCNQSKNIEVKFNISFNELRELYEDAEFVLNAVDDRYWPVGITSFCEAMAMNLNIVTSGNHSCSGYTNDDGTFSYTKVNNIFDEDEWIEKCNDALVGHTNAIVSPRNSILNICSLDSMTTQWNDAINLAKLG